VGTRMESPFINTTTSMVGLLESSLSQVKCQQGALSLSGSLLSPYSVKRAPYNQYEEISTGFSSGDFAITRAFSRDNFGLAAWRGIESTSGCEAVVWFLLVDCALAGRAGTRQIHRTAIAGVVRPILMSVPQREFSASGDSTAMEVTTRLLLE
jgi:hypothetical protein